MERADQLFKQACQKWHLRFSHSLRADEKEEVGFLAAHVARYADEWHTYLIETERKLAAAQSEVDRLRREQDSAHRRYRLLREMSTFMKQSMRRTAAIHRRATLRKLAQQPEQGGDNDSHA